MSWSRFLLVASLIFVPFRAEAVGAVVKASGLVLSSSGQPLPGATVELRQIPSGYESGVQTLDGAAEPPPAVQTSTDGKGRFILSAPRAHLYRVVVRAPGLIAMEASPLALVEDVELEPVELPPDAGLAVRVVSAEGRALPTLWVFAAAENEADRVATGWRAAPRKSLTGPDGTARLPLRDGESLNVSVFADGFAEIVRAGVQSDLTINLGPAERGREAGLRVVDPEGRPSAGALLRIGSLAWPVGRTDGDGRVRFRAPTGTSTILRVSTPDGWSETRELAADSTEVEVRLPVETLRLSGSVRDAGTRAPLGGALVWSPAEPGRAVLAGADGSYQLTAPEGRAFSLRAEAAGHLGITARATEAAIRNRHLPSLGLLPVVSIQGSVVSPAGQPIADARLEALAGKAGDAPTAETRRSTPAGHFELRRLAGGKLYEIRATRPGFLPASLEVATPGTARPLPPVRLVLVPSRPASGTVVDGDNRPLANVRVCLRRSSAAGQREPKPFELPAVGARGVSETKTDAHGRFTVPELPASEVDVLAAYPGFVPTLQRHRQMPPGTGSWNLGKIVLRPGVALAGRVVDQRGKPVAGAEIHRLVTIAPAERLEAILRDEEPAVRTGADGRFTLSELPAGKPLHLFVSAADYLPATVQGLQPPTANLVIRMQPGARVAGRVLDETGDPIAGAEVHLAWRSTVENLETGDAVYRRATTDHDGRFEIRNAPAGTVQITASARGFVEHPPFSSTAPLPAGNEIEIRLQRGVVLQGQIKTTAGDPVAGARVTVDAAAGRSNADGFYHVEGARPGPAVVDLYHPDYRRLQRKITLEAGNNTLDLQLEAGRRITGRVIDEDGAPVSAAEVSLETSQLIRYAPSYQARTTPDGRFEISSVAPGQYQVNAEAEGFAPMTRGDLLAVRDREIEDLELVLGRSGTVAGQVLGLDPEQLARVEILADDGRISRHGSVDMQGRYSVRDLSAGSWEVTARLVNEQREVKARVVVAAGESVERDLEFGNHLTLSGRVEYGGEPLQGAQVAVRASHLTLERNVTTGHDGSFRIEDLEPDTYWLGVSHSREILSHNETLTLTGDREVVIRLEAGSLSGKVSDATTGEPVAAATLQLHPTEGADFLVAGAADESGHFHLPRVPAGRYSLLVKANGYSPAETAVEVSDGAGSEVEVDLEAAPGLALKVRLASGAIPGWIDVRAESLSGAPPITERRQVAPDGQARIPTLPAGTWQLVLGADGGSPVQLTATVPGPPVGVTFPNAAPLLIEVPALAESNLVGIARLTDSAGTVLTTFTPTGQLNTQEPVIGGHATVANVPAGVWKIQIETPDGRRWNAVTATDGQHEALVQVE